MKLFRILLERTSPFLSEPTSGVILGQLAWMFRYLYGEEELTELLAAYQQADASQSAPPFFCSNALIEGQLPRPPLRHLLPAARRQLTLQVEKSEGAAATIRLNQRISALRDQPWVATAVLSQVIERLNAASLFAAELTLPAKPLSAHRHTRTHTAMNRLTNAAQQGILYDHQELLYPEAQRLVIWVRIADAYATDAWLERWRSCVQLLALQGIGSSSSSGWGACKLVENLTPQAESALPAAGQPNAFLSLSSWVPAAQDPAAVAYQLETRHGKLGGLYGSSDHVWKYPVTTLLAGSLCRLSPGQSLRPAYGRLVEQVHEKRAEIVDFGYAFPIGVRLEGIE